ncbi:MAG TPA: hypothetical protein VJ890_20000, partial [Vineibacter sp.]|nr:hypothetical protein [Vineibacter sp.]
LAAYRTCVEGGDSRPAGSRADGVQRQTGLTAFRDSVASYAAFHWKHMRIEEDVVLRLAEKHFDAADWAEMEAAFAGNRDPLRGISASGEDFRALFTRIVNLAPAPIGLKSSVDAS